MCSKSEVVTAMVTFSWCWLIDLVDRAAVSAAFILIIPDQLGMSDENKYSRGRSSVYGSWCRYILSCWVFNRLWYCFGQSLWHIVIIAYSRDKPVNILGCMGSCWVCTGQHWPSIGWVTDIVWEHQLDLARNVWGLYMHTTHFLHYTCDVHFQFTKWQQQLNEPVLFDKG